MAEAGVQTSPAATSRGVEKRIKVRPTLFIALGGTGMEIIMRLRRRILQSDWNGNRITRLNEFPVASFLYFDTDTRDAQQSELSVRNDPLWEVIKLDDSERIQEKVDVAEYQRNRRRYHEINEWLPSTELDRIDTSKGAGQVRAISRLLFFSKASALRDLIKDKLDYLRSNISNATALDRLGLDVDSNTRIVVLGSAAGGTGSGTFLDMGYMLQTIRNPTPAAIDLFLVLAGGYTGFNRDRVYANTFAAMMELEHCARRTRVPAFVEGWTPQMRANAGEPVYSDVYLIDNSNIGQQRTKEMSDIYGMISDILFEDFGSGEFATHKRSVGVNQEQHKMGNFFPRLPKDLGGESLFYSRLFSSVGQTTIDTQAQVAFDQVLNEVCASMIASYFGVRGAGKANAPTPQERDLFANEVLFLAPTTFSDFPEDMRDRPAAVQEISIVREILRRTDGTSIDVAFRDAIERDFQNMMERTPDHVAWPEEVRRLSDARKRDVKDVADRRGLSPIGQEIQTLKTALLERILDSQGLLAPALYVRLDNRDKGGLDYTVALCEQLKDKIGELGTGSIGVLEAAGNKYGELADSILADMLPRSLDNLSEVAKPSFFGAKRRAAETFVSRIKSELQFLLMYLVRQRACTEAVDVLRQVSVAIGERQGQDDAGNENWSGLVGQFLTGRKSVEQTLSLLGQEAEQIAQILSRKDAMYMVVEDDRDIAIRRPDPTECAAWAEAAFDAYGGSAGLFPIVATQRGRFEIANKLRGMVRQQMADEAQRLPSIVTALQRMNKGARTALFDTAIKRALPWVNAKLPERMGQELYKPAQYKVLIAIEKVNEFREAFANEIRELMPLPGVEIALHETSLRGRLVIYAEVSGFPLHAIVPLEEEWQSAYSKLVADAQQPPLHTFRDADRRLRFPNPIVPSLPVLESRQIDFALFIRAVVYGVIRRVSDLRNLSGGRTTSPADELMYQYAEGYDSWLPLASERGVRTNGLSEALRPRVQKQVAEFEDGLTPLQVAAAYALLRWTASRVYASRRRGVEAGEGEERVKSFSQVAAEVAAERLHERFVQLGGTSRTGLSMSADELIEALTNGHAAWTMEIPNSIDDVTDNEANFDTTDPAALRAQSKRRIRPEAFADEALRIKLTSSLEASASSGPAMTPATGQLTMEQLRVELTKVKEMQNESLITNAEADILRERLKQRAGF